MIQGVTDLTGVKAEIEEYDPYYSGVNPAGTNATVMLNRRVSGNHWAQFGWWDSKIGVTNPIRRVGLEFFVSSSDNRFQFWAAQPIGQKTEYRIVYAGGGVYEFIMSGTHLKSEAGISTPTEIQIFGETHDRSDQMPGGSNLTSRVTVTNSRYMTGATHVFHTVTNNFGTANSTSYGFSNPSDGNYEMWDKACAN